MFDVVALSGKAGVGKDFIFNHHLAPLGYKRWALADHFKIWIVGQGKASYDEVFTSKPPHIRKLLQEEGTERGRNIYGDTIWLDTAYMWMLHLSETMGIEKYCLTDIRFPNEADYVKARGGKVIRIEAPTREAKSSLSKEARKHISETALNDYKKFDGIIYNDPEYSERVKKQICEILDICEPTNGIVGEEDGMFGEVMEYFDKTIDKMQDLHKKVFGR
jgi:hypothetical protein